MAFTSRWLQIGILVGNGLWSSTLSASLTINVTGVVVEGQCEVNGGETIYVDFGRNLQSQLINGERFMQTINYSLACEDLTSNDLEMQFEGTAASFSDDYLATDRDGLGIKIYIDGAVMPLNQWMPFTWPAIPVLQAAPIKMDGTEVETGIFSASATMKIQYQ
jgi:type 1 fimbria pilin